MNRKKHIVIVGATSYIATHCARIWSQEAYDFTLVGRNEEKLQKLSDDLSIRSPESIINTKVCNFTDAKDIEITSYDIYKEKTIDIVLIAQGTLPDQEVCQNDLEKNQYALEINGLSPVLFAEAFMKKLTQQNHGDIIIIGSVAGDRGRKSNYVYGAAKELVSRYTQGLQHRLYGSNVHVLLVKPGPTDTPMTAHLKEQSSLASVEKVAKDILQALENKKNILYTPGKWRIIMLIIQHLPSFVFNKINI